MWLIFRELSKIALLTAFCVCFFLPTTNLFINKETFLLFFLSILSDAVQSCYFNWTWDSSLLNSEFHKTQKSYHLNHFWNIFLGTHNSRPLPFCVWMQCWLVYGSNSMIGWSHGRGWSGWLAFLITGMFLRVCFVQYTSLLSLSNTESVIVSTVIIVHAGRNQRSHNTTFLTTLTTLPHLLDPWCRSNWLNPHRKNCMRNII